MYRCFVFAATNNISEGILKLVTDNYYADENGNDKQKRGYQAIVNKVIKVSSNLSTLFNYVGEVLNVYIGDYQYNMIYMRNDGDITDLVNQVVSTPVTGNVAIAQELKNNWSLEIEVVDGVYSSYRVSDPNPNELNSKNPNSKKYLFGNNS